MENLLEHRVPAAPASGGVPAEGHAATSDEAGSLDAGARPGVGSDERAERTRRGWEPLIRDWRLLQLIRAGVLLAGLGFLNGPLPRHPVVVGLAAALGLATLLTIALAVASRRGRTPRAWPGIVLEASFAVDAVVLLLLLQLTGGADSALLPLAALWAAVGVLAHRYRGAVTYTVVIGAVVVAQPVLDDLVTGPTALTPTRAATPVVAAALLTLISAALAAAAARTSQVSHDRLRELVLRDPLTGAGNRRALGERLEALGALYERNDCAYAVAVIDLDHFKGFNDARGHEAGDAALRAVVDDLEGRLRQEDEVFRVGGEEFVVLFPAAEAEAACRALRRVMHERDQRGGASDPTFSVGIAAACEPAPLQRADERMYEAKRRGRAQIVCPWTEGARHCAAVSCDVVAACPAVGTAGPR